MASIIRVNEVRNKFYIFGENGKPLGEENHLLAALAFARGALEENLKQNPFDSSTQFFDSIIINLSLSTAVNLMNAIRETSIMALADYSAINNAYKRGHSTKE